MRQRKINISNIFSPLQGVKYQQRWWERDENNVVNYVKFSEKPGGGQICRFSLPEPHLKELINIPF
jgi:hypothetical protein